MVHKRLPIVPIAGIIAVLLLLTIATPTQAHRIGPGLSWETRLLHDNTDDHGGHVPGARQDDGHDLMALDIQELYDAEFGPSIAFRLYLNPGGYAALTQDKKTLRDEIHFTVDGQPKILEFQSNTADTEFTGTFQRVEVDKVYREINGKQVREENNEDGDRRVVIGTSSLQTLGIPVGAVLDDFQVKGYHAQDVKDIMGPDDPGTAEDDWFVRADYTVRGPSHYADTTLDKERLTAAKGDQAQLTIELVNVYKTVQEVTLTFPELPGFVAQFHDGEAYTSGSVTFDLPKSGANATVIHLFMVPTEARVETGLLELRTSLGGYENWTITFEGTGEDGASTTTDDGASTTEADSEADGGGQTDDEAQSGDDAASQGGTPDTENPGDRELIPGPGVAFVLLAGAAALVGQSRPRRR